MRSIAKWLDQGEKPTKYFCSLENRNYISKCMPSLNKSDGTKTESENEIVDKVKKYYKNLYANKEVRDINLEEQLNFNDLPKLTKDQKNNLEGDITKQEAFFALSNMKHNKSPGSDGFTVEFFKCFWTDIGDFFIRSINNGFSRGELSVTQKEGVITCIRKGDKDKQLIKNWRPMSLLNVSYKIALQVLKFYADASGLHINIGKTKVVWFGGNKGSDTQLLNNENLCWENGNFTV